MDEMFFGTELIAELGSGVNRRGVLFCSWALWRDERRVRCQRQLAGRRSAELQ